MALFLCKRPSTSYLQAPLLERLPGCRKASHVLKPSYGGTSNGSLFYRLSILNYVLCLRWNRAVGGGAKWRKTVIGLKMVSLSCRNHVLRRQYPRSLAMSGLYMKRWLYTKKCYKNKRWQIDSGQALIHNNSLNLKQYLNICNNFNQTPMKQINCRHRC